MEIKKIHKFFLFVFSISGLIFYLLLKNNIISDNLNLLLFCFFMILILGVSHGALDHWRGKKIFHPLLKKKWSVLFYPGYILLSLTVIFGWILFPVIALLLFLLVASYHFGEEDLRFFIKGKGYLFNLVCFFKGLLIITLSFHYNYETTAIFFEYLMVSSIQYEELTQFKSLFFSINLIFVIIGLVFLLRKQIDKLVLILFEIIFITLAFIYLPLILAFSMILISNSVFAAGTDNNSGSKVKKLSSYDSAIKRIQKAKRGTKQGSKKGRKGARVGKKTVYVNKVRALRYLLKVSKDRKEITNESFKAIYKKIGGNTIRNKAHLRTVIAEEITTQKS